jgi:hypothetical protein
MNQCNADGAKLPQFAPMTEDLPIMVQLSPRRHLVVFLSWPITGGGQGNARWRNANVRFGPASYDECVQWVKDNCETGEK